MADSKSTNHTWTDKQRALVRVLHQRSGLDRDAHDDIARVFDHVVRNVFQDKISQEGVSAAKLKNIDERKGSTWKEAYDFDNPSRPVLRAREVMREEVLRVVRQALVTLGMPVPANDDEESEDKIDEGQEVGDSRATRSQTIGSRPLVHASDCSVLVRGTGFLFSGIVGSLGWSVQMPANSFATNATLTNDEGESKQTEVWMCIASKCTKCTDKRAIDAKAARYQQGGDLWK